MRYMYVVMVHTYMYMYMHGCSTQIRSMNVHTDCLPTEYHILYSRKFSLVQIFVDLLSRPLEEIFVVLNFAPGLDLVLANTHDDIFCGSYFRGSRTICKNCKILHNAKISSYRVIHNSLAAMYMQPKSTDGQLLD